ncbi:hypothetical protein BJV78DRAFT_1228197, partial [Lactifluus subvellereus]
AACLPLSVFPSLESLADAHQVSPPGRYHTHCTIYTLNDYVLLNVFHLYRLDIPDEYDEMVILTFIGVANVGGTDLHLLCTHGVPIANMLAHSPPLPLIIYYHEYAS